MVEQKIFWRGVLEELLWFISGSTDAKVMIFLETLFNDSFLLSYVLFPLVHQYAAKNKPITRFEEKETSVWKEGKTMYTCSPYPVNDFLGKLSKHIYIKLNHTITSLKYLVNQCQ